MQTDLPYWLQTLIICGSDGEDDNESSNENDDNNDGEEEDDDTGNDSGSDKSGKDDDEDDDDGDAEVEALRESLKKERRLRRQAEREARKAAKKKTDDAEDKDLEKTRQALEAEQSRAKRLAAGFLSSKVDEAILEAARNEGFIDPTDALTDDIRKAVDADQDEDDPTDIDIDIDTVKDAVKKLAAKKKHLVGKGTPGERSGGKFRRKQSGDDETARMGALQQNYPSLR